ncbi:hypothetical protein GCM10027064_22550 [Microbacterium petrolearium]
MRSPSRSAKGARWRIPPAAMNTPATTVPPSAVSTRTPSPSSRTAIAGPGWTRAPASSSARCSSSVADSPMGKTVMLSAIRPSSPTRWAARAVPSSAIGRPACSWPSQNGHAKARRPHSSASPGTSGSSSATPVARITRRAVAAEPSASDTANSPTAPETSVAGVSRSSTPG